MALEFIKEYSDISSNGLDIIISCRRSVLINNDEQWAKNNSNDYFNISMGSLDSAEALDLVGLFILYSLSASGGVDRIDLYRDDGLMIVKNSTK